MKVVPQGLWLSRTLSVLVLIIGTCVFGVAAQSSLTGQTTTHRPSLPPLPSPPTTAQEQFLPYWTTEPGWESEIQLRNNQPSQALTVTPVLRTPNGAETDLPTVTVKPHEAVVTDIAAGLRLVAPQLLGQYGSVALRYKAPTEGSLYSMAMIRATGKPIALHIDSSSQLTTYQAGGREGIWWLPGSTTNEYLIVMNQGQTQLQVGLRLYDASGKVFVERLTLAAGASARYSLRQLVAAGGLTGSYGGITISAAHNAGSLDSLNFLFDEKAGFSALLKMYDHDPAVTLRQRDFAKTGVWTLHAPMLALSVPDPLLEFPAGTILEPQLLIRNTTGKPVDANLNFQWKRGTETGPAAGPSLHLNPFQTIAVDVAALQRSGAIPGDANWASVKLTTSGNPGDIMAVASSYDKALKYGAQTPFSDQLAFHWVGTIWEYDATHDSLIAVGNGGTKPTTAALILNYNHGAGAYEIDQLLQPDQQMWVDVGQLIREQVPDKFGNTLPAGASMGGYELQQIPRHAGGGSLFEGKVVYDKKYGNVTYGCLGCCGIKTAKFYFDPLGIPLEGDEPQEVEALDTCSGTWIDITSDFDNTWATANHAVATVDAYGTHAGVAVGSTTTSSGPAEEQGYSRTAICPIVYLSPGGGDNVPPKINSISCTPQDLALGPTAPSNTTQGSCSASVSPSGGSYSWSVNTGAVTLNNSSSASPTFTAANASSGQGDTKISLTYTYNGQSASGQSAAITVHKPASLEVSSDTGSTQNLGCGTYCGVQRVIQYVVLDTIGTPIPISGLPVTEQFASGADSCSGVPGTPNPTQTVTDSDGSFNGADVLGMCSPSCLPPVSQSDCTPTGSCTVSFTQTWSVAGVNVRTNSIAINCKQVQVTPQ